MAIWKLTVEYDGTRYNGWQKQSVSQMNTRTVQGDLIRAAEKYFGTRVEIGGSGRTDSGVHAVAQIAHLKVRDVDKPYGIKQIQFGLNDNLPADINITKVETAFGDFNARHDAKARYYVYQISTRRTAFAKPYVWWVKDRLNVDAMRECCRSLIGKHDFFSFSEIDDKQSSTMVKVENCELATAGDLVLFRIGASHFLWKMVRRIVGALVEVGRGKLSVYEFEQLLNKPSRVTAAWTAPPSGLFLEKVLYDDEQITELKPLFPVR